MHTFLFAKKNSTLHSASLADFTIMNSGKDEILFLSKTKATTFLGHTKQGETNYTSRIVLDFDLNLLKDYHDIVYYNTEESLWKTRHGDTKFILKLYVANNLLLDEENFVFNIYPMSPTTWREGIGLFNTNPKTTTGVSWQRATVDDWETAGGDYLQTDVTGSIYSITVDNTMRLNTKKSATQYISVDLTQLVLEYLSNDYNGFLIKFPDEVEADSVNDYGALFLYSTHTNTALEPALEIKYNDYQFTSSNFQYITDVFSDSNTTVIDGQRSGSLIYKQGVNELNNVYIYYKNLQLKYDLSSVSKIRINTRLKFQKQQYAYKFQMTPTYLVPEQTYYSITEVASGEVVIPFSEYTQLSVDELGNYFTLDFNGLHSGYFYKIKLMSKYESETFVYDTEGTFKVI